MHNFTASFAAAFAAATLLLAAPTAKAQSTGFMAAGFTASSSEVASIRTSDASATELGSEVVHNLSTPPDEVTNDAYYDDSHKDLKQALAWMQETNTLHPEYWSVYAEARIRLQLKDYAGAQAKAEEAKKLALLASNHDYARRSGEVAAQAKARTK